jgi:hypothetical protein
VNATRKGGNEGLWGAVYLGGYRFGPDGLSAVGTLSYKVLVLKTIENSLAASGLAMVEPITGSVA